MEDKVMDGDIDLTPKTEEISDVEQAMDVIDATLDRFLDAASVDMVYGEPIQHGSTLIIPSAELLAVLGFGLGAGSFARPQEQQAEEETDEKENGGSGYAGGGGGGGRIFSRPVAVIVASSEGVVVKPVVDATKIALAAITAAGFMFSMFSHMRRGPRG
jgi:uncharacterized spore protein YtfJ